MCNRRGVSQGWWAGTCWPRPRWTRLRWTGRLWPSWTRTRWTGGPIFYIWNLMSNIWYPISDFNVRCPITAIRYPISDIRYRWTEGTAWGSTNSSLMPWQSTTSAGITARPVPVSTNFQYEGSTDPKTPWTNHNKYPLLPFAIIDMLCCQVTAWGLSPWA